MSETLFSNSKSHSNEFDPELKYSWSGSISLKSSGFC